MFAFQDGLLGLDLRVLDHPVDVVDGGGEHRRVDLPEVVEPRLDRALPEDGLEVRPEVVALEAAGVRGVLVVRFCPRRPVDGAAELRPEVVRDEHREVAVCGLVVVVRGERRAVAWLEPGVVLTAGVLRELVAEHRDGRVEHRHLDALPFAAPLALEQRGGDAPRRVQPGRHVDHQDVHRLRPVALPNLRGEPADPLDERVERRPGAVGARPVAADRAVDEFRIELPHRRPVEPEPLHRSRAHVLQTDVGVGEESLQHVGPLVGLQVEGEAPLARVVVEKAPRELRLPVRVVGEVSHPVGRARPRRLHLDHLGTHVPEKFSRERARDGRTHLDHANAAQWAGHTRRSPGGHINRPPGRVRRERAPT